MQDDAVIGRTVRDYTDSKRRVACLEKELSDIGEHLIQLGTRMKECPERLTVTANEVIYTASNKVVIGSEYDSRTAIPPVHLDRDHWAASLAKLRETKESRSVLCGRLREMGLSELTVKDAD